MVILKELSENLNLPPKSDFIGYQNNIDRVNVTSWRGGIKFYKKNT